MDPHTRTDSYLDTVTSPLEGDDELRLDVRAELAAHLDEAAAQFEAEGHSPDESADLAIRTLGPATDYTGDLVDANRGRMRLRGRIRLLLRALLIPATIVAALVSLRGWTTTASVGQLVSQVGGPNLSGNGLFSDRVIQWMQRLAVPKRSFSREQRLILHGDPARTNTVAGQRAIWEAWPTNLVYLNNYLTELYSRYDTLGRTPAECLATLDRELDKAIGLDPRNARYGYMRAAKRLEQAATVEIMDLGKDERGEKRSDFRLTIRDRAMLDQAMAAFLAGTREPVLRRYTADMLQERLAIMGQPRTLLEQIQEASVAAGTLLPDLSAYRNLARASLAYASLLMKEGRPDEARAFIDAWQPFTVQLADDSFTLIDVLVAGAIARIGQANAVTRYHELGDSAAEARTLQAATALCAPVAAFKARVKMRNEDQARVLRRHASILTGLLLPALGESVTAEELASSRMVEYVLLDQITCGVVNVILLVIMFAALLVALRWRFVRGGAGAPLLLLPSGHHTVRILGCGVILPLGVYVLWTWLTPLGGRDISLAAAWPLAATQAIMLATGMVAVIVTLSSQVIRARCETLGVATPPPGRGPRLLWSLAIAGGLMLAAAQCARWLLPVGSGLSRDHVVVIGVCLAGFAVSISLAACITFFRHLFGSACFGLYRGTVARSLIPYLALAIVLVTLLTNPYLSTQERHLIRTDPLMAPSSSRMSAGFTAVETRITERLRTEMLNAAGRSR